MYEVRFNSFTIYDLQSERALRGGMRCVSRSTREGMGWMSLEKILLGQMSRTPGQPHIVNGYFIGGPIRFPLLLRAASALTLQIANESSLANKVLRMGWDSNPRKVALRRFSRPLHSTTLPPIRIWRKHAPPL